MKQLVIAEKPSVAKTLAEFLGVSSKGKGYFFNDEYYVSWAIGHMVSLAPPKAYTENPWRLENLPIIPKEFKKTIKPGTKDQFFILKDLIEKSDIIVNAADAGREGELIFRYITDMCNTGGKTLKRLWVSSYTKKDLQGAFSNLQPQENYQGLYLAGKARSEIDWIYGMNATIAFSNKMQANKALSLGRVQTPTFCMVTKRFLDNQSFKVEDTFTPVLVLEKDGIKFEARAADYFLEKNKAQDKIDSAGTKVACLFSEKKTSNVKPPMLFDLTSLQIDASKKLGLTAQQTLSSAQRLYEEHKMLTYPRTDSCYLGDNQLTEINQLIKDLSREFDVLSKHIDQENIPTRAFNSKKVTDHHAIIPTGELKELSGNDKDIFELVLKRFLGHFSKDAKKTNVTYVFGEEKNRFQTKQTVYTEMNWKSIYSDKEKDIEKLPVVEKGDILPIQERKISKGQTKPPPILTEDTLLGLMLNCGKDFIHTDNPEIKKEGIGRPATRASIIERIISVGYVKRDKKYLVPTKMGLEIYPIVKGFEISNIQLTGKIEERLYEIQEDKLEYAVFMPKITTYFKNSTYSNILAIETPTASNKTFKCPSCQEGTLKHYNLSYKCSGNGCGFTIKTNFFRKEITPEIFSALLQGEEVPMKGLSGKSKKKFNANVKLNVDEKKLDLIFPKKETDYECPKCEDGKLNELDKFYGCSNYSNGCNFSLFKVLSGHRLTDTEIETLLKMEETALISDFVSYKKKSKFQAKVMLAEDFKTKLIFEKK